MTETLTPAAPVAPNYSTPGSKLVLPVTASLEEWLEARKHGVGGSDASAILNLNKWKSAYGVYLDKMGLSKDVKENAAMRWGKLHEPAMRQAFIEDTGIKVRSAGLHRSKTHPWMQVTVDGLTEDGGIFESKTLGHWTAEDWDEDQVADHAEVQVQHGMFVTGRSHAWVVGLIDGRDFRIRRVERNEELIAIIVEQERKFWQEHVLMGVAPAVTEHSLDEVKDRYQLGEGDRVLTESEHAQLILEFADLTRIKAEIKALDTEELKAQATIREIIGSSQRVFSDETTPFLNLPNNGTFSAKKFREDHPDEYEKYTLPTRAFDPKALEAANPKLYTQYRARVLRAAPKPKAKK